MTNLVVAELGESVVEARVVKWLKNAGDRVAAGEPLVELETEKIDLEVSADRPGVIASIKQQAGEDVKVGEVLATLDEDQGAKGANGASGANGVGAKGAESAKGAEGAESATGAEIGAAASTRAVDVKATPTAKNVAKAQKVDLEAVAGSGTRGRVTKNDILRATSKPVEPVAPVAPVEPPAQGSRSETRERMSKRRATIARRLVEAQRTAAMLTTFNEVDMSAVMSLRERRKEAFQKAHGVGIGIASFFVKAAVGALKAFPQINAEIQGDEVVFKHYYDIGMAVGAEGGLVVPVLRD